MRRVPQWIQPNVEVYYYDCKGGVHKLIVEDLNIKTNPVMVKFLGKKEWVPVYQVGKIKTSQRRRKLPSDINAEFEMFINNAEREYVNAMLFRIRAVLKKYIKNFPEIIGREEGFEYSFFELNCIDILSYRLIDVFVDSTKIKMYCRSKFRRMKNKIDKVKVKLLIDNRYEAAKKRERGYLCSLKDY